MAIVQSPLMSIQASGSVSGLTASVTRSGAMLRARRRPVQPRSESQQARRYDFGSLNRTFLNQTRAVIESWNDFASTWTVPGKLGTTIHLSGSNWFSALNSRLLQLGHSVVTAPPLNPNSDYYPAITIAESGSPPDIVITFDTDPADEEAIWVYYTGFLPLTSTFQKNSIRLRTTIETGATGSVELIANAEYPNVASIVQFKVICTDNYGRSTPAQNFLVETTP